LGGQRFHHFALELRDVYLAELIDVCEDLFRQFFLIIFKQVDQKSRAAGDIELAAELVGRLFIHLANQVEEELDYVGLETVNLRLMSPSALNSSGCSFAGLACSSPSSSSFSLIFILCIILFSF
jgi:hypothetical protein